VIQFTRPGSPHQQPIIVIVEQGMIIMMTMFIASGIMLAALSVPMILKIIPPNGLYGFRVKKTMENPNIWYPVNAYSGKLLLAASLVQILISIGLYIIPDISLEVYSYAILAVWVVIFTVVIVASFRYLNSL
jgi:hypothetical protein